MPAYLDGRQAAQQYAAGDLTDYELVWKVYDVGASARQPFLDGLAEGLQQAGKAAEAETYRTLLAEAVTGNQFATAKDVGAKHARRAITNEQVQGVIHSSLGVSRGVALGWKAGYIRGFAAQRLADTAAAGAVDQRAIGRFHKEAAVVYHALRAAIGQ
jgi:hypothetical protein